MKEAGTFSLVVLLAVASTLRGQQPAEIVEGVRALYRGDFDRAAVRAASYVKLHPDEAAGIILLARIEIAQGKYTSAYGDLRQALRLAPTNQDALYYLARITLVLSQLEYQRLFALAPNSARVHQLLAESYRAQENTAKAEEEYRAALDADPRSVEVLDALGDLVRASFRFDSAITYYSRATEIEPRDYTSAYGLGAAYLFRQDPQRAIEYFRRALDLDAKSAAARLALGDALLRAGDAASAVKELKTAATLEPNLRQTFTLLAQAYQKLGDSHQAEAALQRANELTRREIESRESKLASDDLTGAPSTPPPEGGDKKEP